MYIQCDGVVASTYDYKAMGGRCRTPRLSPSPSNEKRDNFNTLFESLKCTNNWILRLARSDLILGHCST